MKTDEPQDGDGKSTKWPSRFLLRSLMILTAIVAGLCLAVFLLPGRDDLLGLAFCVTLIALAIWTLISLQNWAIRARNRRTADRSADARDKRPWQFSLRSLLVATTICAGACSLLKIVPPELVVFVLYAGVCAFVTVFGVALVLGVIDGVTALIERPLSRPADDARRTDADGQDDDSGPTVL